MRSNLSLPRLKRCLALFLFTVLAAMPAFAVDLDVIKKELKADGVTGWIHGSVDESSMFVFTYRNPENYFDMLQISLVTEKPEITAQLKTLIRHDKIRVKGELLDNPSPQPHLLVSSIEVLEKYQTSQPAPPYEHETIPDDLRTAKSAVFLVHAVAGDGAVLVLEYGDQIVPVYVKKPELTKDLFRNDLVELKIRVQGEPDRPMHLRLDDAQPDPVKVLQKITDLHGKPAVVEGALVLFPQSPDIIFNVFAVQEKLQAGLSRQYTLINFNDPVAFKAIREKLQKEWDKHPGDYVNGRNKLFSNKIRIRATGTYNVIDPGQANVQILLKDASSIEIL